MTILSSRSSINILNSMPRLDTSFLLAAVLTLVFLTKYITVPHKNVVKGGNFFSHLSYDKICVISKDDNFLRT